MSRAFLCFNAKTEFEYKYMVWNRTLEYSYDENRESVRSMKSWNPLSFTMNTSHSDKKLKPEFGVIMKVPD